MPGVVSESVGLRSRLGFPSSKMSGKSKVCRCLFGKPSHSELRKDLDEQLNRAAQNSDCRTTWNFSTDEDRPLEGRFEWTPVSDDEYVPSFYRKGYSHKRSLALPQLESSSPSSVTTSSPATEDSSSPLRSPVSSRLSQEELEKTPPTSTNNKKESRTPSPAVQRRIEDFMPIRKRRRSEEDEPTSRKLRRTESSESESESV